MCYLTDLCQQRFQRWLYGERSQDNTWVEAAINYNNAPAVGGSLGASGAFGAGVWISTDVTAYISGDGVSNLVLTTPGDTSISLVSREGTNPPQLVIETQ